MHHHYGMLHHVNCSCLPQFSFFHNLSVTCWLTVGRLSVTCRSTDGQQLTDSRPTGFLGSSSSQLPNLYLGVHLFLGAIFRKHCFPCHISIELPSRCKLCILSHISHLTETHQNSFHICICSGRFKIFANCCVCMYVCIYM